MLSLRYAVGFVALQVVFLLAMVALGSTRWFLWHDGYPGLRSAGYSMQVRQKDCDLLIYGDSSTLTGLDPQIVGQVAGMRACNIAEGGNVQNVTGSDFPLDTYLANNKRPRILLMMFTPSLFRPYTPAFKGYADEGMAAALRYMHGPRLWGALLIRPVWLGRFGIWAGHAALTDFLSRHVPGQHPSPHVDTMAQRVARDGVWPLPLPPETHCVRTAGQWPASSIKSYPESVAAMRQKYGSGDIRLILDVAPVPDCDTLQDTYRERTAGQSDNQLETLPIRYFNEGDVHFSEEGVRYLSIEMGQQVLALKKQRAATPTANKP